MLRDGMTGGADPGVTIRPATQGDLASVRRLIADAALPLDGLDAVAVLLVAESDDAVVGTVALERYVDGAGTVFLLRSAAVTAQHRGWGIGAALTAAALDRVDAERAPVALLTETADGWFPRFGFRPVARDELPEALAASAELRGACPDSARALLRRA
ncbi:GNAT family N-acetyltransferase [Petropleomorpha daqingensis]|uniref:Amino-acid N-acetyltransferase n=1 Tax=Petropleomorpha daqingensis TaxID=2026353 RepID=A0A853CBC1_9ACTN|nr:GNAT family N-acetyltransferase [Petropleomorpha daqingensis]NYJ05004.1 amino-acid N-acetyltransferase [Petropleomorpha daqingensis]